MRSHAACTALVAIAIMICAGGFAVNDDPLVSTLLPSSDDDRMDLPHERVRQNIHAARQVLDPRVLPMPSALCNG